MSVWCTSLHCELPGARRVVRTLQAGGVRVPHRALGGDGAYRYHDLLVARALRRNAGEFDVVHVWPRASLHTARAARALGIRAVREAPNTHTGHAFDAVARECEILGIAPPRGHSHTTDARRLRHEEAEYAAVDVILCQSEFSRATFLERGVPAAKVAVHQNGTDVARFRPGLAPRPVGRPLTALFAGRLEPRKGLHYALDAWRRSGAGERGGRSSSAASSCRATARSSPRCWRTRASRSAGTSRTSRASCARATSSSCRPSRRAARSSPTRHRPAGACSPCRTPPAPAEHRVTGLVHPARDVDALAAHLRELDTDPALLQRLRAATVERLDELTWARSAEQQAGVYAAALAGDLGATG